MNAETVSVPLLCCSAPRAVSTTARSASASRSRRRPLLGDRDAGDPLHPLGPVGRRHLARLVEAAWCAPRCTPRRRGRSAIAMCSRPLASARSVPGVTCRCSVARRAVGVRRGSMTISDAAACLLLGQPAGERRHRLGRVAADQQDHVRARQVGQRERQPAVDAERPVARRRGRRHAEPAVVVDARGAQRDPGELAEPVGLLVGEAAAAEDPDAVPAVRRLRPAELGGDPVERLVPADGRAAARPGARGPAGWSAARPGVSSSR